MKIGNGWECDLLTAIINLFLIILTGSCNDSKISDKKNNSLDEVKYKSQLNWMGHYYLDEKSRYYLMKEVEREFRLRNQEVDLKLVFAKEITDDWTKENEFIVSIVKSGNYKFDIIDMEPGRYNQVGGLLNDPEWGRKYLVDFSDSSWFKKRHKSIIYDDKRIRQSTGNMMTSPYIEGIFSCLWINTRVLAQIGGSLKQSNLTIRDIHDLIDKVKTYNATSQNKIAPLDIERGWDSYYDLFRMLFMSAYFQETSEEGKMDAGIKAVKRVAEELEYLQKQSQLKNPKYWEHFGDKAIFKDKALIGVYPSFAFVQWQNVDSVEVLKLVPCELPIFEHDSKYYPGHYQGVYGVLKKSPNVENAIKLIKYLCSESVAERWLMYSKSPTGLKTRITSSDFDQNNYDKFYNYINKKYPNTIYDFDPMIIAFGAKYNSKYTVRFKDNIYKVLFGEMTAKEYMSQFQKLK